jgi:hypothetical protein
MLPKDLTFWMAVVVGLVVVVTIALALGRGFEVGKWFIRVKQRDPGKDRNVIVADKLKASDGKIGDITGIKQTGAVRAGVDSDVVVLRGAQLRNVDVGDITGVQQDGGSKPKT